MVAYTGDPRVDFVLSQPDVQRNIRYGKINRKGQVPLLAGADEYDDSLSHIDGRFPRSFPRPGGGRYSADPHLHVHETVEKWVQENGPQFAGILGLKPGDITTDSPDGKPRTLYGPAHYGFATPAEKASVEADGVDWGAHNAHTAGAYSAIKGQKADASPPTLYDRPYRDDGATGLLQPSKAADMDYSGLLGNGMGGYGGLLGNPGGMGPSDPYYAMMMGLGGQPSQSSQQPQTFPIPGMMPQITPDGSQMGQPPQFPQPQPQDQSGFPQISTYDPASGLPPSMERNFVSGGQIDPSALQEPVSYNDPSAANAAATPPAATPPPASAPAQGGGFFGPQNADIMATLGGSLLQGPTLRQGIAIAGQQLPGVMRQSRANNATVDWLTRNQNIDPQTRALYMANPAIAQAVAEQQLVPHRQWTQIGQDILGRPQYGFVDPVNGTITPATGTAGQGNQGFPGEGQQGTIYDSLPKAQQSVVDQMLAGRLPIPSSFALRTPYWNTLIAAANEKAQAEGDPSGFDAIKWGTRLSANKDFTSGQTAKTITAGNTAIGHLDELDAAVDKLGNFSGIPFGNYLANQVRNVAKTGSGTATDLQAFDAIKSKYSEEITKFYRGTGGSEADIQEAMRQLDSARSPAELHSTIHQQVGLIQSKIDALHQQWHNAMGDTAKEPEILSGKSQQALDNIEKRYQKSVGGGTTSPASSPVQIKDDNDYNALPSGTQFIGPDGQLRVKP